ncbi:MAG: AAA family ATPase [Nitrospirae bacterium]|nr:AAA family ATPase [Nitrospirota bacterium]
MYERFYGFQARPFSKTPDPKFLFLSRTHEEALARLQYAVEEREIVVLTGEIGCGKTTLTRTLMDSLGDRYRVIVVLNPRLTSFDLVKTLAARLRCVVPSGFKSDLLDAVYERLYEDYRSGITPVLIVDEAHLIPYRETFEEIRLLTNFQMDDTNLLSLVLVGQPDLRRKLDLPALSAFKQRVRGLLRGGVIGEDETGAYIGHRVAVGGRDEPLFTDAAVRSIFRYSGGIPRIINSLAHMSLLEGFARDADMVDESMVRSAAREIGLNGYCKDTEKV